MIFAIKEKLFTWILTADNIYNACGVLEDWQHFFIESKQSNSSSNKKIPWENVGLQHIIKRKK
jgi:hypothetical protein